VADRPLAIRPTETRGPFVDMSADAPPGSWEVPVVEPFFKVQVSRNLKPGDDSDGRLQSAAERLSGVVDVPQARLDYFSAFEAALDVRILGWHGYVKSVRETPQGSLVELRVVPRMSRPYITYSNYREQYLVNPDGSTTYLKSSDPDGLSGQPPRGAAII
jgi:hypothetical protein